MRAVKGKDTAPEMIVRRALHSMGYRYRLHRKDLPGKPDISFIGRRKVIFVHGCFWHGHGCARGNRIPKTNTDYWMKKVTRNRERDTQSCRELVGNGWRVLVIWECELRNKNELKEKLRTFLEQDG